MESLQNWGLMGVPALIGYVLNKYCKGLVVDGMQTYDYTLPMCIFACFGVAALLFAVWLKAENKKKEEIFNAKEEIMNARKDLDQEIRERRGEVQQQERRIIQKEENLERKIDLAEKKLSLIHI